MKQEFGRYSKYLRPISIFSDLFVVTVLSLYFFRDLKLNTTFYLFYQTICWITIAFTIKFYQVYRFTTPVEVLGKLARQAILFLLVTLAFFPFNKTVIFSGNATALFLGTSFIFITGFKSFLFLYLKKYRIKTKNNFRNVVILGHSKEAIRLKEFFESRLDYGYRFFGFFSDVSKHNEIVGKLDELQDFVLKQRIDEVYCSLKELSNVELKKLIDFADEHNRIIKFIPDTKDIFTKNLKIDYYELFPVLSFQKTQLHDPAIAALKRMFDITFSLLVIIFLLSWLIPVIAIIIKFESKGPLFFKQGRPGLDEKEFFCYKFRSMQVNKTTETEASKNDPRVTKTGRFIRKTSIDELPQFINVLMGDMSVVGPRPHLWSQNKSYANKINQYMVRHYVKPGITGLAQVKGFRGEIENDYEMKKRIQFDVFYIENWSLLMDVKIIIQTVVNIFQGEEKAY